MSAQFEPSAEMIEAGARALNDFGIVLEEDCSPGMVAEIVLRAALNAVLSEPCPTCAGSGCDMHALEECPGECMGCDDCHGGGTRPPHRVWAWLRAAQNSGVIEWCGSFIDGDDDEATGVFRVSVPSTPGRADLKR